MRLILRIIIVSVIFLNVFIIILINLSSSIVSNCVTIIQLWFAECVYYLFLRGIVN